MFCVAVFEQIDAKRKRIRDLLVKCSFAKEVDMEIETLWFTLPDSISKMERYASRIQIALIPAGNDLIGLGRRLYEYNSKCLICYYSDERVPLEPFLNSRPIAFHIWENDEKLQKTIQMLILESARENAIFNHATRKTQLNVPLKNIKYFQSDLKHVVIKYCDGQEERIFGKLQDIENKLISDSPRCFFIRVHKSYLVNALYVFKLDKADRTVELLDHETIPVSEAQYLNTLQWLEKYKSRLEL